MASGARLDQRSSGLAYAISYFPCNSSCYAIDRSFVSGSVRCAKFVSGSGIRRDLPYYELPEEVRAGCGRLPEIGVLRRILRRGHICFCEAPEGEALRALQGVPPANGQRTANDGAAGRN